MGGYAMAGKNFLSLILSTVLMLSVFTGFTGCSSQKKDEEKLEGPKVTITETASSVTLDNGLVSFTIDKGSAKVTKISKNGGSNLLGYSGKGYYLINYVVDGKRTEWGPGSGDMTYKLVSQSDDQVEIALSIDNPKKMPFYLEIHFIMRRGSSGIYFYDYYKYTDNMPDNAEIEQARYAFRVDPNVFKHYVLDDDRRGTLPAPSSLSYAQQVQDATYKLLDGTIYTKYDAAKLAGDDLCYGLYGENIGITLIKPSNECVIGGPTKQDLTLHQTDSSPILLWHDQSAHYGTGNVAPEKGWEKIYGPVFLYINEGDSVDVMWNDAKSVALMEKSKWPYKWIDNEEYDAKNRGTVKGQIVITDGTSAKNAWIILGAEKPDFQMQSLDYLYYVRADKDGKFTINTPRPGTYTLYAIADGEFGEYRLDGVVVKANKTTDLGKIEWTPENYGIKVWQIGIPDRSAAEYKNGADPHHYGLNLLYPELFPEDVNFRIGESKESEDFYYVHTGFEESTNPKIKGYTPWNIIFNMDEQPKGMARLTIALASSDNGTINVYVNETLVKQITSIPGPAKDAASYRSGNRGIYRLLPAVEFDASLLKQGENTITLTIGKSKAAVMYDSIKLELKE